jgi:hypothetical protein
MKRALLPIRGVSMMPSTERVVLWGRFMLRVDTRRAPRQLIFGKRGDRCDVLRLQVGRLHVVLSFLPRGTARALRWAVWESRRAR